MERTAFYKTNIGILEIGYTDKYIISVNFVDTRINLNNSQTSELSDKAIMQINEYLNGDRIRFDIPIYLQGTDFQKQVWKTLCQIPYGKTASYKEIAQKISNPKAARAVGKANNKNKIAIIVPCHRVIGSNGELLGYAAGLHIKQKLLDIEKIQNNTRLGKL